MTSRSLFGQPAQLSIPGMVYYAYLLKKKIPSSLACSIYIPPFRTTFENIAYVQSVINETVRCSEGKVPVYAFHWNCKNVPMLCSQLHYLYLDYHNGTTLLDPEDLFAGLVGPYDQKSHGVIMWGSTAELKDATFIEAKFT